MVSGEGSDMTELGSEIPNQTSANDGEEKGEPERGS